MYAMIRSAKTDSGISVVYGEIIKTKIAIIMNATCCDKKPFIVTLVETPPG